MTSTPAVFSVARAALAALLLSGAAPAIAAGGGLGESDYRYLKAGFGLGKDSFTLSNIAAEDAARLHELITDPAFKDYPKVRERSVGDYLFGVELRTCQSWELAHAGAACPQVGDARLRPGWEIAERNCIACHLTGTTAAPSFFKLAQSGTVDEKRLADALAGGHQMSPITLGAEQLRDLALYINSLR
ncbi:MAG: c-type cytochrome [Stellaceae bacterium]